MRIGNAAVGSVEERLVELAADVATEEYYMPPTGGADSSDPGRRPYSLPSLQESLCEAYRYGSAGDEAITRAIERLAAVGKHDAADLLYAIASKLAEYYTRTRGESSSGWAAGLFVMPVALGPNESGAATNLALAPEIVRSLERSVAEHLLADGEKAHVAPALFTIEALRKLRLDTSWSARRRCLLHTLEHGIDYALPAQVAGSCADWLAVGYIVGAFTGSPKAPLVAIEASRQSAIPLIDSASERIGRGIGLSVKVMEPPLALGRTLRVDSAIRRRAIIPEMIRAAQRRLGVEVLMVIDEIALRKGEQHSVRVGFLHPTLMTPTLSWLVPIGTDETASEARTHLRGLCESAGMAWLDCRRDSLSDLIWGSRR